MQIWLCLNSLVFLPLLIFLPPQFSWKYAWFLFPLVFSRTQAASMLQWSRRPCACDCLSVRIFCFLVFFSLFVLVWASSLFNNKVELSLVELCCIHWSDTAMQCVNWIMALVLFSIQFADFVLRRTRWLCFRLIMVLQHIVKLTVLGDISMLIDCLLYCTSHRLLHCYLYILLGTCVWFLDPETGPQALPTLLLLLLLLFLCLFLWLFLSDFQSIKAFSFYCRSSLNFAYRSKTVFWTIALCRIFKSTPI